jgi:DNA-binding NtrC family response regulator
MHVTPTVVVVEHDNLQRELLSVLLEESAINVIKCASAEAALSVLDARDGAVSMLLTDVDLAGNIDGVELAHRARKDYPNVHVLVISASRLMRTLPEGVTLVPKPWLPLDILRELPPRH